MASVFSRIARVRLGKGSTFNPDPRTLEEFFASATCMDLELSNDGRGNPILKDSSVVFPRRAGADDPLSLRRMATSAKHVAHELKQRPVSVGHNLVLHDVPALQHMSGEDLSGILLVDTLWLSPLAFPDRTNFPLQKDYIDAGEIAQDPNKDTALTVELLREQVEAFGAMDVDWLRVLQWLCGLDDKHAAYDALFRLVFRQRGVVRTQPLATADILTILLKMFDGEVCRRGLHDQLTKAFGNKDGWQLAWALNFFRHRSVRPAPQQWLLETWAGFRDAIDDLGRRRCSHESCTRCKIEGSALDAMLRWFPEADPSKAAFQPPLDLDGVAFQEKVMQAALARRSALGILPTGTGKSRCFQVPALEHYARTGDLTVVISPLKALMDDQFFKAEAESLPGVCRLHGDLDQETRDQVYEDIRSGHASILYLAPERLGSEGMRKVLGSRRIGMWVIDEVHCLSAWGQGFRPDYRRALEWIKKCGAAGSHGASLLCLTATARHETAKDIQEVVKARLGRTLAVIDGGAERPNLTYRVVERDGDIVDNLDTLLSDTALLPEGGQAIVYAFTRKDTSNIAEALRDKGHSAAPYHAKLAHEKKKDIERRFSSGDLKVIVATIAFGMGVDTPNVRLVLHAGAAASLEAYAQEAGRAGRDRAPAHCVLVHCPVEADRRLKSLADNHLQREDMDVVLGHILDLQRRVRDAKQDRSLHPTLSLPYRSVIRDVLGIRGRDGQEDVSEYTIGRVERIISELETHGLVEKVPESRGLTNLSIDEKRLADLIERKAKLPKTERAIVEYLHRRLDEGSLQGSPLPSDEEELADLCNLTHPGRASHVATAVKQLRRKKLFKYSSSLEISLSGARDGNAKVETWKASGIALIKVIADRFEQRAAEDAMRAEETGEEPPSPLRPLDCTLASLTAAAQIRIGQDHLLTQQSLISVLTDFRRQGLLHWQSRSANLTLQITMELRSNIDTLREVVERYHQQADRVLATLRKLADGRTLTIGIEQLTSEVASLDMDLDRLWCRPDGESLTEREAIALCRARLRQLNTIDALYISRGLFMPSEECRVAVARRSTAVTRASYRNDMFEKGVDAFQKEEIRQQHLMTGYAEAMLKDGSRAPELLRAYFAKPSEESLDAFYEGEALEVAKKNRPATVARQIELRSRLDDKQAAIVHENTDLKDMLVLAGPGSGKTRVLVERIIWLVSVERVPPDQILALCYNRRAAEQIRSRLRAENALGRVGSVVSVYTYHAFALQVLGKTYAELSDQIVAEEAEAPAARFEDGKRASAFDRILAGASTRLQQYQADGGNLGDIILRRFRWVFVDEFQDVTDESFALIREISQQSQKKKLSEAKTTDDRIDVRFCAVGDDDQNIYDFGGASGKHIQEFEFLFPDSLRPELYWNYRSSGAILDVAADVIGRCQGRLKENPIEIDPGRRDDPMQGLYYREASPELGKVSISLAGGGSIRDHALLVAAELLRLKAEASPKLWRWASTAVLVRNRKHIPIIENALSSVGIEVSRDIQGLVPLPRVREAMLVRNWLERADRKGLSLVPAEIETTASWLSRQYPNRWGSAVSGKLFEIAHDLPDEAGVAPRELLDDFLEWAQAWQPDQSGVAVLTCHSSKGLEFDNVVVCDAEWTRSTHSIKDADRRLLYVGVTRARHSLSLVTSDNGPLRYMASLEPGDSRTASGLPPRPDLPIDTSGLRYTPCSVRNVFLSFPAWDGKKCEQTDAIIDRNSRIVRSLKTGSPLILRKTGDESDRLPWHLFAEDEDGGWHRIGKMQHAFDPGAEGHTFRSRVFALVTWFKTDSDKESQRNIKRRKWTTVIPEWSPAPPAHEDAQATHAFTYLDEDAGNIERGQPVAPDGFVLPQIRFRPRQAGET
ncbi:RecQ family ATP-dependent DNA helicase [Limimaricola soesokkakensis]|uniref:RecQ family ATP-dependent DNA helicase n=1 Tax=Limimaricola soesokkakensis TaxID=1343159 RepID=UPI003518DCA2